MAKKRKEKSNLTKVSKDTKDWLEHHTMEDMKELTCEMYSDGVDVSEMVEVVNKLEEIAEHELGIHEETSMPNPDGTRKKLDESS
ncbi:MAG: hypothetical protein JSV43_08285 [Methanobacteriota archaeon]|nr:MAG: hypothetical protein JSV43_08285 [Euryarchaeota archaeon]